MEGWICLYRSVLGSEVFGDAVLLKIWIWCLIRASYQQRFITMPTGSGTTRVEMKPGQFVYGRRAASKELKIPASTVRRMMKRLETMGNISQKADRHFTVVTICHWASYQGDELACGPAADQPRTNRGPAVDTNNKGTKEQRKKKSADVPIPADLDTPEFREAWGEWLAYRRGRRLTCTSITLTKQLTLLAGWGVGKAIESINASITNGWTGLFDQKEPKREARRSSRF